MAVKGHCGYECGSRGFPLLALPQQPINLFCLQKPLSSLEGGVHHHRTHTLRVSLSPAVPAVGWTLLGRWKHTITIEIPITFLVLL